MPIAQYPEITPPTVEVSAIYPGADARWWPARLPRRSSSRSTASRACCTCRRSAPTTARYTLTVTFKLGIDLNIAQVLVQNRVAMAQPILPDLVTRKGVTVKKKSPSRIDDRQSLLAAGAGHANGTRDNLYLSNYATIQIRDELARLPGVGDITYLGQRDYSMRLWLDPDKMRRWTLSASDVVAAIQQQNIQVAAGQIGQPPVPDGQVFQYTMTTLGRLADPEQFERDDAQERQRGPRRPHEGYRPHRTRRAGLRPDLHARSAVRRWRCRSTNCPAPTP